MILRSLYRNNGDTLFRYGGGDGNGGDRRTRITDKRRGGKHVERAVRFKGGEEASKILCGIERNQDDFWKLVRKSNGYPKLVVDDRNSPCGSMKGSVSNNCSKDDELASTTTSVTQTTTKTVGGNTPQSCSTSSPNDYHLSFFSPLSLDVDRNDRVNCDYYCTTCGTPYLLVGEQQQHTQYTGACAATTVRIRSLKRGKTRRRRASRKRASAFVRNYDRLMKNRGGGKSFSNVSHNSVTHTDVGNSGTGISHGSAVMAAAAVELSLKECHGWRSVGDGMSKNCVVYTCGYCGTKRRLKGGLIRGSGNNNEQNRRPDVKGMMGDNSIDFNRRRKSTNTPPSSAAKKITSTNTLGCTTDEDFIKLDKCKTTPKKKLTESTVASMTPLKPVNEAPVLSLLHGKKKKKVRKSQGGDAKQSKLMDFLSSLND